MEKNLFKSNKIVLFIFCSLALACGSIGTKLTKGNADGGSIIENIIIDFSNSDAKKKYNRSYEVFVINDCNNSSYKNWCYDVSPVVNKIMLDTTERIGLIPRDYIPNRYKEYSGKLFVWNDNKTALNNNVLKALYQRKLLDSTFVNLNLGKVGPDDVEMPETVIDESLKSIYYFICKDDISIYKKVKTTHIISKDNYPRNICN